MEIGILLLGVSFSLGTIGALAIYISYILNSGE